MICKRELTSAEVTIRELTEAGGNVATTLATGVTYALYPEMHVDPLEAFDVAIRILERAKERAIIAKERGETKERNERES